MKRDEFIEEVNGLTKAEYEERNNEYSNKIISLFHEVEKHLKEGYPDLAKSVSKEMEKPARRARAELRHAKNNLNDLIKLSVLKSRMRPESRDRKNNDEWSFNAVY